MTGFELSILDFIQNSCRSGIMDHLMVFITHLGDLGIVWIIAALALVLKGGERKIAFAIVVGIVFAAVIGGLVLKPLVARHRPCDIDLAVQLLISRPTDFSFPSGHTAASFVAVSVLCIARSRWRVPAAVLAVLIALSRLYLFVHYPTDVLAGALLGILSGWLAWQMCSFTLDRLSSRGKTGAQTISRGTLVKRDARVRRLDSDTVVNTEKSEVER